MSVAAMVALYHSRMAILHRVRRCWCGERHTHGEVMRLNSRDIPKVKRKPRIPKPREGN